MVHCVTGISVSVRHYDLKVCSVLGEDYYADISSLAAMPLYIVLRYGCELQFADASIIAIISCRV